MGPQLPLPICKSGASGRPPLPGGGRVGGSSGDRAGAGRLPPESTSPGELGGACRGLREAPLGLQGTLFPPASPGLPSAAERAAAHTGKEPMLNHLCWDCLCVCS